jgi:ABC-type phosphate transport system substrate-binding protein
MLAHLALCIGLLGVVAAAADAPPPNVVVIVHPSRTGAVSRDDVQRIYLNQRRFWEDGRAILPVNREYGSDVRKAFERIVFADWKIPLSRYWNEQYFLGILPPATLASDSAVRQYVAARPDAIGYIDARNLDDTVRVVLRLQ